MNKPYTLIRINLGALNMKTHPYTAAVLLFGFLVLSSHVFGSSKKGNVSGDYKPDAATDVFTPIRYKTEHISFSTLHRFAQMAQASYSDDLSHMRAILGENVKVFEKDELMQRKLKVFVSGKKAQKSKSQGQYIVIRGTANTRNIIADFDIMYHKSHSIDIELHRGFRRDAGAIYAAIKDELDSSLPIYITGHSLGGALAVILDAYLRNDGFNVERVVTFGQPKVTNTFGASVLNLDAYTFRVLRVVHGSDAVTLSPAVGYAHFAPELVMDDLGVYCVWPGRRSIQVVGTLSDHAIDKYLDRLSKLKAEDDKDKAPAIIGQYWGCSARAHLP